MWDMRVVWILSLFQLSCFALKPAPPLDIAEVNPSRYSITLDNKTKTFGFQDTFNKKYTSTNGSITLFPDGCLQVDGAPNCTAACQDNTQIFSNFSTLHNCAVFPEISVHLANNNLTANARRLAEELKITSSKDDPSLPSKIFNKIQSCLLDSCSAEPDCNKTLYGTNRNHSPNNLTGTLFITNSTYLSLCGPIPAYVNADAGGIGVFISYVIQMGLALIAFVITIPWASIARGFRTSFSHCRRALSPRRGSSNTNLHSHTSSAHIERQCPEALTGALVSFQKAQCWFMLATNIASLVVERSGGLEPDSLQQLYNTYVFIKVITIGGFLPITFTLLNLHMIKQLSWYPITLSMATIAVATTTLKLGKAAFTPIEADFDYITSQASQGGPPSCGLQSLTSWCYYARKDGNYFGFNSSSSGSAADDILIFCLATLAIILADHFCRSDDPKQQALNSRILNKLGISPSTPPFPHAGTVLRYGTAVFHFVFFWLYIYCFYIFGQDLDWFGANNIYDPSWGFGQIVAILVWMPTLFDYAWDQIRGVPKGHEHKLPKMYEVVRKVQEQHHHQQRERGKAEEEEEEEEESRDMEINLPLKSPYHTLRP